MHRSQRARGTSYESHTTLLHGCLSARLHLSIIAAARAVPCAWSGQLLHRQSYVGFAYSVAAGRVSWGFAAAHSLRDPILNGVNYGFVNGVADPGLA